jgi:hypothetical protein
MLSEASQRPLVALLRDYTAVRIGLGMSEYPAKLAHNVARSAELQNQLWQQAVAVTAEAPQSLPAYRFIASLNDINNFHESRLTALRYHVPSAVMFLLVLVAMVATGFTGYYAGARGTHGRVATLIMSLAIAVVIMLMVDLDRPERGLIRVPVQPLIDAQQGIPS